MALRYPRIFNLLFFLGELVLLDASFYSGPIISGGIVSRSNAPILITTINLVWLISYIQAKNYKRFVILKFSANFKRFCTALIYHILILTSLIFISGQAILSRTAMLYSYAIFGTLFSAILLVFYYSHKVKESHANRILIIGHEDIALRLLEFISTQFSHGYELVDFITETKIEKMPFWELSKKIVQYNPSEIFICITKFDDSLFRQITGFCEVHKIKVKVVPDIVLDSHNGASVINYGNIPVLNITNNAILTYETEFAKRSFDILFSSAALLIGSPLFFALYIITKLTSKGGGIYSQERIGKDGRPFTIYKFRSMYTDAENQGPRLATDGDPRVTKWGNYIRKTRLDELPQFWNVLKGDMSIVGPRPERQYYIDQIVDRNPSYKKLQQLKPGITSMGQVYYGYAESVEQMCDRLHYDLHYLKKIDLNADLKIIYNTVKVMVQKKGK